MRNVVVPKRRASIARPEKPKNLGLLASEGLQINGVSTGAEELMVIKVEISGLKEELEDKNS